MPIKQRTILWYLVFVGFSVNYMQRCNLNIAIIDMISTETASAKLSATNLSVTSKCLENTDENFFNESTETTSSSRKESFYSFERHLLTLLSVTINFKCIMRP